MRRNADGWNIVLAGVWNRAIFTPEWVGERLFHEDDVEVMISVMPYLPIIYRNQQVAVEVSSPRLVFRPRQLDEACTAAAERMAHSVLDALRDTPLSGVGVNFAFVDDAPSADLIQLFNFADNAWLEDTAWRVRDRRLIRRLQNGDEILNLALIFNGESLAAEFNFHTETNNNELARAALHERTIRLRDAAIRLLNEAYHLEVIEAEVNNV